jgi:hypothetical protein
MTTEIPEGHYQCSKCKEVKPSTAYVPPGGMCEYCYEAYWEDQEGDHIDICYICGDVTQCNEHGMCFDCESELLG